MSKKDKKQNKESNIENYYDLKTKEMDELVSALKGEETFDSPPPTTDIGEITGDEKQSGKKFSPYKLDKLSRLPTPVKVLFIKWWFAGMCCFLFVMGLQAAMGDGLDLIVVNGIAMGVITDLFVNPCLRYFDDDTGKCNAYMMFPFPFKKFWTFFTNIIYSTAIMFGVNYFYMGINLLFKRTIGMEPLMYGIIYVVIDMFFIGIKDLIVFLVKRGKRKKAEKIAAETPPPPEEPFEEPEPKEKSAEASALDRVTAEVLKKDDKPENEK